MMSETESGNVIAVSIRLDLLKRVVPGISLNKRLKRTYYRSQWGYTEVSQTLLNAPQSEFERVVGGLVLHLAKLKGVCHG